MRGARAVLPVMLALLVALAALAAAHGRRATAQSQTDPPARFYGALTVDNAPGQAGVSVSAYVAGTLCGSRSTTDEGAYRIDVIADGQTRGCGAPGARVTFRVGDRPAAETGCWQAGQFIELNLTVGGATQSSAAVSCPAVTPGAASASTPGQTVGAAGASATAAGGRTATPTATPAAGQSGGATRTGGTPAATPAASTPAMPATTGSATVTGGVQSTPAAGVGAGGRGTATSTAGAGAAGTAVTGGAAGGAPPLTWTGPFPDGAFVYGQDGNAWVVSAGARLGVTWIPDEANVIPALHRGPSVSTAAQLALALAPPTGPIPTPDPAVAPFPPGAFVIAGDGSGWVVTGGLRLLVTFLPDEQNLVPALRSGPRVSTAAQLAIALSQLAAAPVIPTTAAPNPGGGGTSAAAPAPAAPTLTIPPPGRSPVAAADVRQGLAAGVADYAARRGLNPYVGDCQDPIGPLNGGAYCALVYNQGEDSAEVAILLAPLGEVVLVSFEAWDGAWVDVDEQSPGRP